MELPHAPRAVVFDMDGLLFDTEAIYQKAILSAASEAGHDMPASVFQRLLGSPWVASRTMLIDHYGEAFDIDALWAAWMRNFETLITDRQFMKPGVTELLDTLDALGILTAIATSSSQATVRRHLATHGLSDRFGHIVGHGDYARGKPAPDPFLLAAKRLGVLPTDCIALEDSHNGVRSAAAAGMMTIMVPDMLPATDDIAALCVGVADSLHQVAQIVRGSIGAALGAG